MEDWSFLYLQVTQFSCNSDCIAAQEGCFQYFTGVTGTIESYNFNANTVTMAAQVDLKLTNLF